MATTHPPLTDQERAQREEHYREVLATLRLEGLEPDAETDALFQRYANGEMTLEEMGQAIDELNDREFGPLRLAGHDDPAEPARPA